MMNYCRVCSHPIEPFMTFGQMPIANAFLHKDQFDDEYFYELMPASCHNCTTFQIVDVPILAVCFMIIMLIWLVLQ